MSKHKSSVLIITVTVFLCLSIVLGISFLRSKETVEFKIENVSELKLYHRSSGGNPSEYIEEKPSQVIKESGKYSLKKGYYIYVAEPKSNDYSSRKGSFNTNEDKLVTVTLDYSTEKLLQIYNLEATSIESAINNKYPTQMKNYEIKYGKLYIDGTWFAGYLISRDGSDNLQVILHKKNGAWEVAAIPNITISKAQYPEIPYKVIESVNVRPY